MILPELENGGEEAGQQLQGDLAKESDLRLRIKYVLTVNMDFQRIQDWTVTE
jgi:hypothetical protein